MTAQSAFQTWALGAVAGLLFGGAALAQSPASPVRAACEKSIAPVFSKQAKDNRTLDCGCVSDLLVRLYGEADAAVIPQFFGIQSKEEADSFRKALGDRFDKIVAKIGNLAGVGREIDKACVPAAR